MRIVFTTLLCILCSLQLLLAQRHTVSGVVADSNSGERLLNATLLSQHGGTVTNDYGFFSISLPKGENALTCSFVGYAPQTIHLNLTKDTLVKILLTPSTELEDIVVSAQASKSMKNDGVGNYMLSPKQVDQLPVLMGERDVIRAVQMLPGVQACNDASGGMIVRGGGTDGNLILLDDIPVFNINHLFGIFSVFDSDPMKSINFYSGGFSAKYGGRTSSVLDLKLKDGNQYEYHGKISVGIVSSKLFLEGPIKKDKSSFMVSARRTYLDLPIRAYQRIKNSNYDRNRNGYYFYDVVGKLSFDLGQSDRLYFTVYNGHDRSFRIEELDSDFSIDNNDLKWGNTTSAVRWNHQFGSKFFTNTTLTHTLYRFETSRDFLENDTTQLLPTYQSYNSKYESSIQDFSFKIDGSYYWTPKTQAMLGAFVSQKTFKPGESDYFIRQSVDDVGNKTHFQSPQKESVESGTYASLKTTIGNILHPELGIRYVAYSQNGKITHFVEPRALLVLKPQNSSFKINADYTVMHQSIHLLNNYGVDLPIDLWVPATDSVQPSSSQQAGMGVEYQFENGFRFSTGGYYKTMEHVIAYKNGKGFSPTDVDWEKKIMQGEGRSMGLELLAEKSTGRLSGWMSYTLSKTDRKFTETNQGQWYPYNFDRRHELNMALTYQWKPGVQLNGAFVLGTGNAITLPESKYLMGWNWLTNTEPDIPLMVYSSKNEHRMPTYHRLDGGISFTKQRKHGIRTWNVGAYNLYNRKNPYYLKVKSHNMAATEFEVESFLQFIPYITYNYEF